MTVTPTAPIEVTGDPQKVLNTLWTARDSGDVIIDTELLTKWIKNDTHVGNWSFRCKWAKSDLDPRGLHVAHRVMLHNDSEWRVVVQCKVNNSSEPHDLNVDVSMDDWTRGEAQVERAINFLLGAFKVN